MFNRLFSALENTRASISQAFRGISAGNITGEQLDNIEEQLFLSCHDISDGGIAVAISEMTFGNNIGCDIVAPGSLALEKLLFSETGGFIIETQQEHLQQIKNVFKARNVDYYNIGSTSDNGRIRMNDAIDLDVKEAKRLWSKGLRDKIK